MQYTQEQYVQAIRAAEADNNLEAARELADEAARLYGPLTPPPSAPEPIADPYGPGIGLQRASKTLQDEYQKFKPEVLRRSATIVGQELTPSDLPKVAGVAVSQAARAAGSVAGSYLGGLIPNFVKEGAEDLFKNIQGAVSDKTFYSGSEGISMSAPRKSTVAEGFQAGLTAVAEGYDAYQQFKQTNPEAAEQIETAVDLQALFSPRPDLPSVSVEKSLDKAAKKAGEAVRDKRRKGVVTLLTPSTPELTDVFEEKGILRTKTFVPSAFDNQVIDTVTDMKGVDPKRSYTYNYSVVQKQTKQAKEATDRMITAQNKPINSDKFTEDMGSAIQEVLTDPLVRSLSGDIQKELQNLTKVLMEAVEQNGNDLVGVLEVRRRFDDQMNGFSGNPNAKKVAGRTLRNVLNDTLKNNTKGDELHNLLTKQFHGITAMEEMLPKRNAEGNNVFARLTDSLKKVDLLPSTILALTATGGAAVGQIGGAGPALIAGGIGTGTYATLMLMRPENRLRAQTAMLSAVDKALKTGGVTAETAMELKIDRALLVDYINQTREEVKEEKEATNE